MTDITQTSFVQKSIYLTRRGNFIPRVEEIYQRRDIPCGYKDCILCTKKLDFFNFDYIPSSDPNAIIEETENQQNSGNTILIIDIPGLLGSLDCLLSSDLFPNQVIPHSILDWLQRNSRSEFKKLKTFLELDNHGQMRVYPDKFSGDVNNVKLEFPTEQKMLLTGNTVQSIEACAKMAGYFSSHLSFVDSLEVIILSGNKRLRILEQIKGQSPSLSKVQLFSLEEYLQNYVTNKDKLETMLDSVSPSMENIKKHLSLNPKLVEDETIMKDYFNSHSYMVSSMGSQSEDPNEKIKLENEQIKREKLKKDELMLRVNKGELFRGKLRISRNNINEGSVGCRVLGRDVLIQGKENFNLAVNGDFVAVEVFPVEKWQLIEQATLRLEDETQEAFSTPLVDTNLNQGEYYNMGLFFINSRLIRIDPFASKSPSHGSSHRST
jgi:hypothetical protein